MSNEQSRNRARQRLLAIERSSSLALRFVAAEGAFCAALDNGSFDDMDDTWERLTACGNELRAALMDLQHYSEGL